ncbi:MAG: SDR family oxidoreductase [Candidatus Obscuribacterales bacterium]
MTTKVEEQIKQTGDLLKGKKGIILGVANDHSLAWFCAQQLYAQGAQLAFTYQAEPLERRVRPLAESVESTFIEQCDLGDDAQIEKTFAKLKEKFGTIDFLIHAVAFANKAELEGHFIDTSRDGFKLARRQRLYIHSCRLALPCRSSILRKAAARSSPSPTMVPRK